MNAAPTPTRRGVRWGIGDALWVWFVGLVAGAIAGSVAPESTASNISWQCGDGV